MPTKTRKKKSGAKDLPGEQMARIAADACVEMNAYDVVILEVGPLVNYTGYFVIASARSTKQAQSVAENVVKEIKKLGGHIIGEEGRRDGAWILIDWGEVVIHVFHHPVRDFYEIEKLWGEAARIEVEEGRSE